jgi:DNA polymerase-3 subunit gamma/tau
LFCGPRGVGKTTCARIFAKTINCFQPTPEGEACNECESCRSFNENRSLNIHELDAASNNSVDDIRALTEQVRIIPQLGKYKVYIIDEVHMLTQSAFNAFLKTLEEPPRHAVFILATTEKHKILPTILSRCQIYDFSRIGINDIVEYLEYVAKQENIGCEREALNVIAQKADGGMRDALSIFDQVAGFSQGNVTYQTVIENLNVLDYDYYFRITDAILQNDVAQCLLLLNEILSKGFDGQHIISGMALFFRDVLVCKDPQTLVLFEVGETVKEKYLELAGRCKTPFLYRAMELTNETDLSYRYSKNKRFAIELLLIRLCQLTVSPEESDKKKTVIERIESPNATASPTSDTVVPSSRNVAGESQEVADQTRNDVNISGKVPIRVSLNGGNPAANKPETVSSQAENQVRTNPFSQEDLIKSWKNYGDQSEDKYLKNVVSYINPLLKEDYRIEVEALNPEQVDYFTKNGTAIKEYLSASLNNDRIELEVKLKAEDATQTLFTAKEKYDHMAGKNPQLETLVKEFNLRLD